MTYEFIRYAQPLIEGEIAVPMRNGVPAFVTLEGYKRMHTLSRRKPAS